MKLILPLSFLVLILSFNVNADEIKFKFKNPSFSGAGTGAHYLTIENQEKSRRDKIKSDIEEALRRAEREDQNSTINKCFTRMTLHFLMGLNQYNIQVLFNIS